MKTNTGPSSRIREALRTIRGIAQEIVDAAADPSRKLSDLFTEAAIQRKVDACMGLALAVAACGRCKWLREVRREVGESAAVVVAADNALAPLMTLNPEAMSNAIAFELKVFELLLAAGPLVLLLARIARLFRLYAISQLHKEFVGVRIQLQASERGGRSAGGRPGRGRQPAFTQKAVATLCGKDVNTVARWESGAIRPPLDYTADLRTKGGVGFFDWVREYNAHNGVADVFVQIQKGNVVYTEGLTEREKGLVEEYVWELRRE